MRLTKTVADAASYPAKKSGNAAHILWDDTLEGFGLRVYPSGKKSFVYDYRIGGRKRRLTIGRYGEYTVQDAREEALEAAVQVNRGTDPLEERRRREEEAARRRERGRPLRDLAADYLDDVRDGLKPSTVASYERYLRLHVLPEFGDLAPEEIEEEHVWRWYKGMADEPYGANRRLWMLSKLMSVAESRGMRAPGTDPTRNIKTRGGGGDKKRYREPARRRYLSASELADLGAALHELEDEGKVSAHAAAAIRLLVLTGARKSEILNLRWRDVDRDAGVATIREHKTDSTTGDTKRIPLTPPVREILDGLPRTEGHEWVIEGHVKKKPMTTLHTPWSRACDRAGITDARIHDLRHTTASHAASSGMSLALVGQILGHRSADSTRRYSHLQDEAVREAASGVAGAIAAAMQGKQAEVVELDEEKQRGSNPAADTA